MIGTPSPLAGEGWGGERDRSEEPVVVGTHLGLDDLIRAARHRAPVRLDPEAAGRARAASDLVRRLAAAGAPVYGVTTGSGANVGVAIEGDALERFQVNVVTSHCVGVGPPLPADVVRAMMLVRAHGIGLGRAGARPEVAELLVACLNAGIHPVVPSIGSVGAADLAPMAHAALVLLGLGEAEHDGRRMPAAAALAAAGLEPLRFGPKDGLVMTSSTAPGLAAAALAAEDVRTLLEQADLAAGLALEGFAAAVGFLDPRAAERQPGPGAVAAGLRALLDGSRLVSAGGAGRVQDPLSFRCIPELHGTSRDLLGSLRALLEVEVDAPADNPTVVVEDGTVVSHGAFHSGRLAVVQESLAIALGQQAGATANRVFRLHSPRFTPFPAYLAPEPGVNCGFATLQKTVAALVAEIRHLALPSSLDALPVAEGVEDSSGMSMAASGKLARICERLQYLVACELLAAAQAVDLRGGPALLAPGTRPVYRAVRGAAAFLDRDRVLSPEIERVRDLVREAGLGSPITGV